MPYWSNILHLIKLRPQNSTVMNAINNIDSWYFKSCHFKIKHKKQVVKHQKLCAHHKRITGISITLCCASAKCCWKIDRCKSETHQKTHASYCFIIKLLRLVLKVIVFFWFREAEFLQRDKYSRMRATVWNGFHIKMKTITKH